MSDWQTYNNLAAEMLDLIKSGEMDSPRGREVSAQLETLKNQHGGYPPPVPPQEDRTTAA